MEFSIAKEYIIKRLIKELSKKLFYHGSHHTMDVVKSISLLAKEEDVTGEDLYLLLTAGYFHDAGFLYKYESNEKIGVKIARQVLPDLEYTSGQIEIIAGIIMATSNKIEPETILQKIMCDADHDYFGRQDYTKVAVSLRKELGEFETVFTDLEWLKMQINYLENKHKYYTNTSKNLRAPKKDIRIKTLKMELENLKNKQK